MGPSFDGNLAICSQVEMNGDGKVQHIPASIGELLIADVGIMEIKESHRYKQLFESSNGT